MFEASVDGEAFDMDRWGQYFKPAGYGGRGEDTESAPAKAAPAPVASKPQVQEDEDPPFDADPPKANAGGEASSRAADIIAMIRNRQKD